MRQLKEEGLIRHYGFSFHDTPEVLDNLLTAHPDAEFVQLQINYADWEDAAIASRRCYEVAAAHDMPVVVMEPVKGGFLADPPETVKEIFRKAAPASSEASWAVRFAASLDHVMIVLSGMSSVEQMRDNLSCMRDFRPLDSREQQVIRDVQEALKTIDRIPCTSCHYCTPGCPQEIHIPEMFSLMNEYKTFRDLERAKRDYGWRPGGARTSACIQCGQCESACPQHLPIISLLQKIADTMES